MPKADGSRTLQILKPAGGLEASMRNLEFSCCGRGGYENGPKAEILDYLEESDAASEHAEVETSLEQHAQVGPHSSAALALPNTAPLSRKITESSGPIAVVGDVEGNWNYFCNYVEISEGLSFVGDSASRSSSWKAGAELELKEGWQFVFCGDAGDKGPGTIRFLKALVRLKKKYFDRVHLIVGNRDLNKLRLSSELEDSEIERMAKVPGPYWVQEIRRTTPLQSIRNLAAGAAGVSLEDVTDEMLRQHNTKVNRLRWILQETMGACGDFERRRQELAIMGGVATECVTDEDVLESYMDMIAPGGCLYEYLGLAQIGVVIGETLFVHGGIVCEPAPGTEVDCIGCVPGFDFRFEDVREWISALNAWKERQLAEWRKRPHWGRAPTSAAAKGWAAGSRGGSQLIAYAAPSDYPSVVIGRHLGKDGMPKVLPDTMVDKLAKSGISRLVLGHTPHGNCPTIGRQCRFQVVFADTSFSNMQADDNRGVAVSAVVLHGKICRVQGKLEDGRPIEYQVSLDESDDTSDQFVGRRLEGTDQRIVKARFADSGNYLLCMVDGFSMSYSEERSENLILKEMSRSSVLSPFSAKNVWAKAHTKIAVLRRLDSRHSLLVSSKSGSNQNQGPRTVLSPCGDELTFSNIANVHLDALLEKLFDECDLDLSGRVSHDELVETYKTSQEVKKTMDAVFGGADVANALSRISMSQGEMSRTQFIQKFRTCVLGKTPALR